MLCYRLFLLRKVLHVVDWLAGWPTMPSTRLLGGILTKNGHDDAVFYSHETIGRGQAHVIASATRAEGGFHSARQAFAFFGIETDRGGFCEVKSRVLRTKCVDMFVATKRQRDGAFIIMYVVTKHHRRVNCDTPVVFACVYTCKKMMREIVDV